MLEALTIVFASAEGEATSKTFFYVAGGALAVFAVIISVIGIRGIATFPATRGQAFGVIGLASLLVLVAAASAIVTA